MKTLLISLLLALPPAAVHALAAAVVRAAEEIAESVLRRGGTDAAKEMAELGGQKAVQELMEQAAREGGEALVKQTAALAEKHGVLALRALKGAPAAVLKAVDGVPAELAEQSLRAIVREPAVMQQMAKEFGSAALEVAARHPGLAGRIGASTGREGLELAQKLTTQEAKCGDDLAKLPVSERTGVMELLKRSPGKVLAWMERHPKILIAGSATAAIVLAKKEIFGEGENRGFLERVGSSLAETFKAPMNVFIAALTIIAGAWGGLKLRRVVKAGKA